jgi:hypothetical protein
VADGALMMSVIASGPDDRDRRTVPNDVKWMEAIKGDVINQYVSKRTFLDMAMRI